MEFKKLKLKKAKVMELSADIESLPMEDTAKVAGGIPTYMTCIADCHGITGQICYPPQES
jgi:hypothetical protein